MNRIYPLRSFIKVFFFHRLECLLAALIYAMRPRLCCRRVRCVKGREWCIRSSKKSARYARVKKRYVLNVEAAVMFILLNLHDAKTVKELGECLI